MLPWTQGRSSCFYEYGEFACQDLEPASGTWIFLAYDQERQAKNGSIASGRAYLYADLNQRARPTNNGACCRVGHSFWQVVVYCAVLHLRTENI